MKSSVRRQKGESQNGCYKKNKARQIFWKTNISSHPPPHPASPTRVYAYQGVRSAKYKEM